MANFLWHIHPPGISKCSFNAIIIIIVTIIIIVIIIVVKNCYSRGDGL